MYWVGYFPSRRDEKYRLHSNSDLIAVIAYIITTMFLCMKGHNTKFTELLRRKKKVTYCYFSNFSNGGLFVTLWQKILKNLWFINVE